MNRIVLAFSSFISSSLVVAQATLIVPSATYPTIQSAIAAAANSDTVLVLPGTYQENLDVLGKDITIRGQAGAEVTSIDGSLAALPTVVFSTGSPRTAVLEGFTIFGGSNPGTTATAVGGGIRVVGSSPTIRNCVVRNNTAGAYGGGIGVSDYPANVVASPLIESCTIEDNAANGAAFASGGGIACGGFGTGAPASNAEIRNCIIRRNSANTRGGGVILLYNAQCTIDGNQIYDNRTAGVSGALDGGAGIFFSLNAVCTITNNRIWRNASASNGGGIKFFNVTGARIVNNTIVDNIGGGAAGYANTGAFGTNVVCDFVNCILWNNGTTEFAFTGTDRSALPPSANVSYSDVAGGYPGTGNINANPGLLLVGSGNHRLSGGSPCREAGDSSALGLPANDFEGDPRVVGVVDMGADEFVATKVLHWADRDAVAVSAPSNVTYSVDGGTLRAGNLYAVLFSLSGTTPGTNVAGLHLPLNLDTLTVSITGVGGILNGSGQGTSVLPLGGLFLPRSLIGRTLSSAAAIVGPGPALVGFTNDENVTFAP